MATPVLLQSLQFLSPTLRMAEIDVSLARASGIIGREETAQALGGLLAAHERLFARSLYLPNLLSREGWFEARYEGFRGFDVWIHPEGGPEGELPSGFFGFRLDVEPPPRGAAWKMLSSGVDCLTEGLLEYFGKLEGEGILLDPRPGRAGIVVKVPETLEGGAAALAKLGISPEGAYFIPGEEEERIRLMRTQAENFRRLFFEAGYPDGYAAELGRMIRRLSSGESPEDVSRVVLSLARLVVNEVPRRGFTPDHLAVLSDELMGV